MTDYLEKILRNLDPSLFQNIILGVLAIFIPFTIVFFTDILNSNKKEKSEFEKMVLSDEVFGAKKVFWISIVGIVFFAFFSGIDVSLLAKIVSIVAAIILISLFWISFKKILKFSEGYKTEFEINFFKNLNLSKIFKFTNQEKEKKMIKAWSSFWPQKSEFKEEDFTEIFISHIDDAINFRKFNLAIKLGQTYLNNIEKRYVPFIVNKILPKVFTWNEILLEQQKLLVKNQDQDPKDYFWEWGYFGNNFFQSIITVLLKDNNDTNQFFLLFEKYINDNENRIKEAKNEEGQKEYQPYTDQLFASFCPIFFDEISKNPSKYTILPNNFPNSWRVKISNKHNKISRIVLCEFLEWSKLNFLSGSSEDKDLTGLTRVIEFIFPNIYPSLFTAFLMLYDPNHPNKIINIKNILSKEPNFCLSEAGATYSSFSETEKNSQKEETIQIILEFFDWPKITQDSLNKDESENWSSYTTEQKLTIKKRARKEKLEKIQAEIESEKVNKFCENYDLREIYIKYFLELITLLIQKQQ